MPDDKFFDDDNLTPDWLRGADLEPDEPGQESDTPGHLPPWQSQPGAEPPAPAEPPPAASPWERWQGPPPAAAARAEGLPPWERRPGPEAPPPSEPIPAPGGESAPEEAAFDWTLPEPGAPSIPPGGEAPLSFTDALPWLDLPGEPGAVPPAEEEAPAAPPPVEALSLRQRLLNASPPPAAPVPEEPDWLGEVSQAAGEVPPESGAEDLEWLRGGEVAAPTPETAAEWFDPEMPDDEPARPVPDEEEAPDEGLPDWLRSRLESTGAPQGTPPGGPAPSVPDWVRDNLGAGAPPSPPTPPLPDEPLSYDEWEQRQIEQEREAQKTPEERLLDEVPDWFDRLEGGAGAGTPPAELPAAPAGPEFVPDWYLGLDETNTEEAPDWFQKLDYSAGALSRPPEVPPTPAGPPPAAGGTLPDWLKAPDLGASADLTPPLETPPPTPTPPVPSGATPVPPTPPPPSRRLPIGAEEQFPLPDMDALTGEPSGRMVAEPEDIPFPDLDLDQVMPAEEGADEALETWMASFVPGAPPGETPAQGPAEDFVERFEPLAPAAPEMPAPIDAEAPDWLRDMAQDEGTPPPAPAELDLFGEVPAGPAPESEAPAALDSLDWLDHLTPEDVAAEPPPEGAAGPDSDEAILGSALDSTAIDDLLGLYSTEPREELPPAEAGEAALPETRLLPPEELEEEEVSASLDEVLGAGEPQPWGPEGVPDLDALFGGAEPEVAPPDVEALFAAPETPAEGAAPGVPPRAAAPLPAEAPPPAAGPQPEWVAEMRPTELPVTVKAGGAEASVRQKQVVELPDRVRALRETVLRSTAAPEAPAPDSGPLAGISGALPLAEAALVQPAAVVPPKGLVVTQAQQARVDRLQALLEPAAVEEEEEAPAPEIAGLPFGEAAPVAAPAVHRRERRRARFKLDRVLIALLLLAGLIAPFATDALHFAADPPALSGRGEAAAAALDTLAPGDYVLVAFDYGPTAAGELDPLAQAVLRDLLARRAIPLITGTNPAGVLHAPAVIAPLAADERLLAARDQSESTLDAGRDYVILSYLPGEAVGVRSLRDTYQDGQGNASLHPAFDVDWRGDKTNLALRSARDVALIIVVGESSEDVRIWAEQLQGIGVPKVALVTASAEALAVPYVNDDGYAGLLAGVRDTYSYNAARNAETRTPYQMPGDLKVDLPDPETARWHSMALGAAVASGLISLGLVVNLLRALTRRARR